MTASPLRTPLPRSARRAGRVFAWVLAGLVVLAVLGAVWLGVRGVLAFGHLRDAQRAATALTGSLDDPATAASALPGIAADTAAARELTSDPVWAAASALPWVGPQLNAVATAIAAVDEVAGTALTPLAESASGFSLSALKPSGGRFDVAALSALAEPAAAAAADTAAATASLDDLGAAELLAPLAEQVDGLRTSLDAVRTATDALARATALMPAVLGADGPRDYLVVFQNNAEWRSLGGISSAMALIHTDGGAMSLVEQASSRDFPNDSSPVVDLSDDLVSIMGTKPAQYSQNATQVPDFAVAAQILRADWRLVKGTEVDGVIALDPVTLSYILGATGPVRLPTGEVITADDAVSLLLSEAYARYPSPIEQDAFFEATAAAVFDTLARGDIDAAKLVPALAQAADENRLLMWSADAGEQTVLDGTTLQGALPVTDAETTGFGVYVNNGGGSKIDYYSHLDVGVGWCADSEAGGAAALTVRLRNDAPADAASSLPSYVTAPNWFGVAAGHSRTVAYLYLPEGGELVFSTVDGPARTAGFGSGTDRGRPVLTWSPDLAPGEEATARIRVRTPVTDELTARVTPVIPANAGTIPVACSPAG